MDDVRYTIRLEPVSKKNSQRILKNRKTGKRFIGPSEKYERYEQEAGWFLRPRPSEPIKERVNVKCLFYMPTRRRVDLTNLLEAVDDVLVEYKILEDDNCGIVAGHDGSRVLYSKDNPRTEITITRMEVPG